MRIGERRRGGRGWMRMTRMLIFDLSFLWDLLSEG